MSEWAVPEWSDIWEPEIEIPLLKELALKIEELAPSLKCSPDFQIEGCAFVQIFKGDVNVGRICLTKNESEIAFYTGCFGENEDEFNGYNMLAIAKLANCYSTELPNE